MLIKIPNMGYSDFCPATANIDEPTEMHNYVVSVCLNFSNDHRILGILGRYAIKLTQVCYLLDAENIVYVYSKEKM